MRLYEFESTTLMHKVKAVLNNLKGSSEAHGSSGRYSWQAIDNMFRDIAIDYETFDPMYQANPKLFEPLVRNYNSQGVQLNIAGTDKDTDKKPDKDDSQDVVNKIAASAAEKNLD